MSTFIWDHVQLRSRTPRETVAWLVAHFEAQDTSTASRFSARIDGVNVFVAPVAEGDGVLPAPAHPHCGLDHFGLTVGDLDAVVVKLVQDGVDLATPVETIRPGVRGCYVLGPDGIWIELLERKL